jgi:hypothetical protein
MLLKRSAAAVFNDNARYRVLIAGRRFGKTRLMVVELARAASIPGARVWCVYPTYRQAKQVAWSVLKDELPAGWVTAINETDLTLTLANKATISLRGADNAVGLDEFDFMDGNVWPEVIRPMLATTAGRALFVGTPDGFGPLYDLYGRGKSQSADDHDWSAHQFTTLDGGWVPAQEIEDAKRDMDERTFRQEFCASFENASGRVYYAFDREHNVREAPHGIEQSGALGVGIDFNVDPMTAVVFHDDLAATHIIDEVTIRSSNTQELAAELRQRYGTRIVSAYPDPAGRARKTSANVGITDHQLLRDAGFIVYSRMSVSVRDGINAVNSRLCSADGTRRLFVSPKCKQMIAAFERHSYKPGTSQPDKCDGFDHLCDAARYPIDYLHPIIQRASWTQ